MADVSNDHDMTLFGAAAAAVAIVTVRRELRLRGRNIVRKLADTE